MQGSLEYKPSVKDRLRWKLQYLKYWFENKAQRLGFWLLSFSEKDSNLVKHAKYELQRAGMFDADSDYAGMLGSAVVELIAAFSAQGRSGFSAPYTISLFKKLASFDTLTPLTSDPDEWCDVGHEIGGEPCWQNRRKSSCFSHDGGKTWYDHNDCVWTGEDANGCRWATGGVNPPELTEGQKIVGFPKCDSCMCRDTCDHKRIIPTT